MWRHLFDQELGSFLGVAFVGAVSPVILIGLVAEEGLHPIAALTVGIVLVGFGVAGVVFTISRFRELRATALRGGREPRDHPLKHSA